MIKKIAILICFVQFCLSAAWALTVTDLSINTMPNPTGIDGNPRFGWKLRADTRNTVQTSFAVNVYTDPAGKDLYWSSGAIESDESQNVSLAGLELEPSTTYYWDVEVTDNYNHKACSTKKACFTTGLMDNWGGANWIAQSPNPYGTEEKWMSQQIDVDITVVSGNPCIIFGATHEQNGFVWQLVLDEGNTPILRKRNQSWSTITDYGDAPLRGFTKADFIGKKHNFSIRVHDAKNQVSTYIDGKLVDQTTVHKKVECEQIGFSDRSKSGQVNEAYFDNVLILLINPNYIGSVALNENFDNPTNSSFPLNGYSIVNGQCHLQAPSGEGYCLMQTRGEDIMLFKDFNVGKKVKSAVLHASALGVFNVWINGKRVGHKSDNGEIVYDELAPGWTDYNKRVQYFTYDVSDYFQVGDNNLASHLSAGWARGSIARNIYSRKVYFTAFLAKLVITYDDGTQEIIATDDTWQSQKQVPIVFSGIYEGETFDARHPYPWEGRGDAIAFKVQKFNYDGQIVSAVGQAPRALEPIKSKSVTIYDGVQPHNSYGKIHVTDKWDGSKSFTLKKGETAILDFGQNIAGIIRFKIRGKKGSQLHVRFAEMLNDSGSRNRYNDGPEGSLFRYNLRGEDVANVYYILRGDANGEEYRTSTSFFGFRYCDLTATDDIYIEKIEAIPVSSSHEEAGSFESDNAAVNKLYSNVMWSQRSNLLSVPTDCPQRTERFGWTFDTHTFATTAMLNANVSEFYRKWLIDLRDGQMDNGAYPDVAPNLFPPQYGNGAWADGGIIVPWDVYIMTGDKTVLAEQYESMQRYMDYLGTLADGEIEHPGGLLAYGDWLSVEPTSSRYVSQAFYANDAYLMSQIAVLLNETSDADKYRQLFEAIRDEMQRMYFSGEGLVEPTQTACALALEFNLYNDISQRDKILEQLIDCIEANGNKIATGFVGTACIMNALASQGESDKAYNLLLQRNFPSWLYSVDQGATTIWEHWDSYTKDNGFRKELNNSFNHYSFGVVVEWLYRGLVGINPSEDKPGFKEIIFKPNPDFRKNLPDGQEHIRHAKASVDSPQGLISADIKVTEDNKYVYSIEVPCNAAGVVCLPVESENTEVYELSANGWEGIEYLGYDGKYKQYAVGSGRYCFATDPAANALEDVETDIEARVYPNPTRGTLWIDSQTEVSEITVYGISGCELLRIRGNAENIDMGNLPTGLYFVRIVATNGQKTMRVIKK